MADGLLAQEYGSYQNDPIMSRIMSPVHAVEQAYDYIARQKAQKQREEYNTLMLDKAQQMSPLDIMKARAEAAKAEAGSTPEMLQSYQEGYMGQNLLQKLAGERAQATQENRTNAENAGYQTEAIQHGREKELDDLLRIQNNQDLPENDRITAATKRLHLIQSLMQTPKFAQQLKLQDDRLKNALLLRDMQNESKIREIEAKHAQALEAKTLEHGYQRALDAYKANPTPENKRNAEVQWAAYRTKLLAQQQGKPNVSSFGIDTNNPVPESAPGLGSGNRKPLGDY